MRRYDLLGWLLLPAFLGCSGQNVVAGEDQSKAEQLAASVPSWCQSTCGRFLDCASQLPCQCNGDVCDCLGVDETCPTSCQDYLAPFTNAGDVCAAVGERLKKCLDRATCDDLGGKDPCPLTDAERAACPHPGQSGGSADEPSQVGANSGYAGSANSDSPGASYGGAVSGPPVACMDSYGVGGGQPSDETTSQVICEEGRDGCADGHAYSWVCVADSQGHRACSCFVDLHVTGAFAPAATCPIVSQVNAGCGWNLAQ